MVNNAAYGLFGALEDLSDEELRREFETNVFGVLNVTRAALPQLRRQRGGHIVQISSLEGIAPAVASEAAYAATKFAVEGVAEALPRTSRTWASGSRSSSRGRCAPTSRMEPRRRRPRATTTWRA